MIRWMQIDAEFFTASASWTCGQINVWWNALL